MKKKKMKSGENKTSVYDGKTTHNGLDGYDGAAFMQPTNEANESSHQYQQRRALNVLYLRARQTTANMSD